MTWRGAVASLALALGVSAVMAQSAQPAFEVVSIRKRDGPQQGFPTVINTGGTFRFSSTNVIALIQFAYQVRDDLIIGGPDWIRTAAFEVNAKAANEASTDEMRPMVESLLKERFGLVAHKEQRVLSHLLLKQAKVGVIGPNLQKLDDCKARPLPPSAPAGAATYTGCGAMASIAMLASRFAGAPVLDGTGLAGTFSFVLHYSPAEQPAIPGLPPLQVRIDPDAASRLPTFRQAMEDQLGLRMESVRGPMDVLVIDSIQQPTEN